LIGWWVFNSCTAKAAKKQILPGEHKEKMSVAPQKFMLNIRDRKKFMHLKIVQHPAQKIMVHPLYENKPLDCHAITKNIA